MRILTPDDFAKVLGVTGLSSFFGGVDWQYPDPVPSFFLPKDSGRKVALSRIIADALLRRGPIVLWITATGIWPSSQHMNLFYGYRLSHGEARSISEAPVHLFESQKDVDAFISILYLGLAFVWDIEIVSLDRSVAMTISHDEWLEYRFAAGQEAFISEFNKWIEPSLRQGGAAGG